MVFTASHSSYANKVIDYLDPDRKWITHRFYREHCILEGENVFIKDLR
jgi:CTD small phosphatase-like protein 2